MPNNATSTPGQWMALRKTIRQKCDTAYAACQTSDALRASARLAVFSWAIDAIDSMVRQGGHSIDTFAATLTDRALEAASAAEPNNTSDESIEAKACRIAALADLALLVRGHAID